MAKDFSADPREVRNFTQSEETGYANEIQDYSEFLPAINRTESLTRFFGSTVNQLLSSGSTETLNTFWGRVQGRNYNSEAELFQPETDADRQNYQFAPGVVARDGNQVTDTVSYINTVKRLQSLGADTDNHDRLFSEPGYVLDMPINIDMFSNYANYYWMEGEIPIVYIEPTVTDPIDIDTIVKLSQYTTPILSNYKTIEFVTGLRVQFVGEYATSTSGDYITDVPYFVENVGGETGIRLIQQFDLAGNDLFPRRMKYSVATYRGWDLDAWDTAPWDEKGVLDAYDLTTTAQRDDLSLNKTYIVMERHAVDKNPWARSNHWVSIYALRNMAEYNDEDIRSYANQATRAKRPIIEYRANMELYNTCKTFTEVIDYSVSIEDVSEILAGTPEFSPDNGLSWLQNGDVILVNRDEDGGIDLAEYNLDYNADFDSGAESGGGYSSAFSIAYALGADISFYANAYTVGGVGTEITLTEYNNFAEDEFIIVGKGIRAGTIYCYKNNRWFEAQNKATRGSHPRFNLYNDRKQSIADHPNTDFLGERLFGYKRSTTSGFDKELGFNPTYTNDGSFSDFVFEWSLNNTRYSRDITSDNNTEIRGFYYWRDWITDDYYNGWSNVRGSQRVPIIQTTIADGDSNPTFDLGTTAIEYPTEYTVSWTGTGYRWAEHSYIARVDQGYENPTMVWRSDTDYTVNAVVSDAANSIVFRDPYGNADANISVTVVANVITVNVSPDYAYSKIRYESTADANIFGEIFISNLNQQRVFVQRNGQVLQPGTDYTISGTTLEVTRSTRSGDVIELEYIADADLDRVAYDVAPVHYYNTTNNPLQDISLSELFKHFRRQISAMPGWSGQTTGENNYHNTVRLHQFDGTIRQQIFQTPKFQYLLDQEAINPVLALKRFNDDYSNFKRFFINKTRQLWETETFGSVRELVDRALTDINLGKNINFKYAHSDMAYYRQFDEVVYENVAFEKTTFPLPRTVNKYGNSQNHVQVWATTYDPMIAKYVTCPLVLGRDYTVVGPNVVLDSRITRDTTIELFTADQTTETADGTLVTADMISRTVINPITADSTEETADSTTLTADTISGDAVAGFDVTADSGIETADGDWRASGEPTGIEIRIRWYPSDLASHIPPSAAKLGFFRPTQVEIVNGVLIGHDGSRYTATGTEFCDMDSAGFDPVTAALWDFETRVFSNLVDEHFEGFDFGTLYPNPHSEFAYTVDDLNLRLDDWFNRYAIRNQITDLDINDYDAGNEFTWNYKSVGPGLGSWRSLYVYYFGTDRPHTHPWEMLGHRVKPTWWDTHYSWEAGAKRTALLNALRTGVVGDPDSGVVVDLAYARPEYDWQNDTLVTTDVVLNGPVTAGVVAAPAAVAAAADFVFGDWSEVEDAWRKSSEYGFALAEAYLQFKPYSVHETYWKLGRLVKQDNVTQTQWIDTDTCQRNSIYEIHNQFIEGLITSIDVVEPGTGYVTASLDFPDSSICAFNAEAEVYTAANAVSGVSVLNPGRGYLREPTNLTVIGPPGATGAELRYNLDDFYLTSLGFNTLPAEEYTPDETDSTALAETLENLDVAFVAHVGGFTDKRIMNIQLDGSYAQGRVQLSSNDYDIVLDRSAPIKTAFFSGVKITRVEGEGYRVDGYNLDSKFFNYRETSASGKSVTVQAGTATLVKHLNFRNELSRIPYGYIFTKRQSLYSFLLGLGEYYESIGFRLREQWQEESRLAIAWAVDSTQDDVHYMNGISDTLTYEQGAQGAVQEVSINYDGVPNAIDSDFKTIKRSELMVLRNDIDTEYSLKSGADRIYGLGVRVVEFEHMLVFKNTTGFGDLLYVPEKGLAQNRIKLVGERTRNWNGRVEAPGYMVKSQGLILNFESSVREVEHDWVNVETKALERLTRQTQGYNVGYVKPTYLKDTFIGDESAYRFEIGKRKNKGTPGAIEAITRSKNIFGEEFEHEYYEEWMVRLGEYGDVSENNPLMFVVNEDKIKSDPQQFRFNSSFVSDSAADLIIDLHKGAPDAVSGDYDTPFDVYNIVPRNNTKITNLIDQQNFNQDAGLPLVDEIKFFLASIDELPDVYNPAANYARVPNWQESLPYQRGDTVRYQGKVYQLNVDSTGLTSVSDTITVRGNQVFPTVENGLTFIADGETVTFTKTSTTTTFDTVAVTGTTTDPTVPSGQRLVLDGINVDFIKTETTTTYSDIVLTGTVTNPVVENGAGRGLAIYYADSAGVATGDMTFVTVDFDEIDPNKTMQDIWFDALTLAGYTGSVITEVNSRISQLEALRAAFVGANDVPTWEAWIAGYYTTAGSPHRLVNPEYLGAQVNAAPGAAWEVQARNLINLDLGLISNLSGNAPTETEATMVSGVLNDGAQFALDRDAANNALDDDVAPNLNAADLQNLESFATYVTTNGGTTISLGQEIAVASPTDYVIDGIDAIVDKINTQLGISAPTADISAANVGGALRITRTNNTAGRRLGVSVDGDLGFQSDDRDVATIGSTNTVGVDLTLTEVIQTINDAALLGVAAFQFENRLQIQSTNETLVVGTATANTALGITAGTYNATPTVITVEIDLSIGDVVQQINTAGIAGVTASQAQGSLIISSSNDTLEIGDGTANTALGISAATFNARTSEVSNVFNENEWLVITDPANFNIWVIDNIGSDPISGSFTNTYQVYQTTDLQLGIDEICAGNENGDDALVKTNREHQLSVGDFVLIVNSSSTPSADGIHRVTAVSSATNFFIDVYIDEKGFTGKVIPLKPVRFASNLEAENALLNPSYIDGDLGLLSGSLIFVDEVFDDVGSLGKGAVYRVDRSRAGIANLTLVRYEEPKTNNSNIKSGTLFSERTGETVARFEVFDPLKGIIPGRAEAEIDLRSEIDLAYYNNSTDPDKELRPDNTWGDRQVGLVWWDLSNAIYLNYDQGSSEYRQEHWGELYPTGTIDIYEWTKSPVTPDQHASAVEQGTVIDGIELTGEAYTNVDRFGEIQYYWTEEIELNQSTNQLETYFYYWVRNKTTVPSRDRLYSVQQLENIVLDPAEEGFTWIAATSSNTLLVSGLLDINSYDDLIMKVDFDKVDGNYHQEFALLAENDPATVIPEWLHINLRDSLAQFTQLTQVREYDFWKSTLTYQPEAVVRASNDEFYICTREALAIDPVTDSAQDYWNPVTVVRVNPDGDWGDVDNVEIAYPKSIPDLNLHPFVRYGIGTRPHQIWFKDVEAARRSVVEKVNAQLAEINLIDSDIAWQREFDRTISFNGSTIDITDYWSFADWNTDPTYTHDEESATYYVSTRADLAALTPTEGEIAHVAVSDEIDGINRHSAYRYTAGAWALIFKEKATIQFNSLLWDNTLGQGGWDTTAWDTTAWDVSSTGAFAEIFDSFYRAIWTQEFRPNYTDLWFHMAKFVIREQQEPDWIFKTSYFKTVFEDQIEKNFNKYFDRRTEDLFDYVNTVKPFRSKLRDALIRETSDDEYNVDLDQAIEIRVQTNPTDSIVDEVDTRSFRLTVGNDGVNRSSQIANEHKKLLGKAISPTETVVPILTLDSTTFPSSGAFWMNGERIEYTGTTSPGAGTGIGSAFSAAFSEAFGGVVLLTGCVRGTQGTFARSHQFASILESETGLELVENAALSDYGRALEPAWQTPGTSLLSPVNLDANGIAINAETFGTIDAYGDLQYLLWLADRETADAIESFGNELEELIEVYWATV